MARVASEALQGLHVRGSDWDVDHCEPDAAACDKPGKAVPHRVIVPAGSCAGMLFGYDQLHDAKDERAAEATLLLQRVISHDSKGEHFSEREPEPESNDLVHPRRTGKKRVAAAQ